MWGATTGPRVTPGGKFMASQRGSALDHTLLEAAHKPGKLPHRLAFCALSSTLPELFSLPDCAFDIFSHLLLHFLQRGCCSGPGAYDDRSRGGLATPGGKFSTTPVTRKFDEPAKLAAKGAYSAGGARVLPSTLDLHGGNFNKGNPKRFVVPRFLLVLYNQGLC
jgi:hypothetical protein